jgi:hypothetical protein
MSIRKEMTEPLQTPITFYSKTKGGIQNSRKNIQTKNTMRLMELIVGHNVFECKVTYSMNNHDWNDNYKSTSFKLVMFLLK